ncbi:hypothetical protein AVEN_199072-1 [Araneus ventricosus]|uniref:Uncharacterized protein n=1 Tax=Araneus ventricosus TaxID=182803 RepID=A0A4Y2N1U8_ARAVE|nr:hypothetical protein AVEN_199072-1 [Araneus ventricosus]
MRFGRDHCLDESYLWAIADMSDNLVTLKDTRKFLIGYSLMVYPDLSNDKKGKLSERFLQFSLKLISRQPLEQMSNTGLLVVIMHLYIKDPTLCIDRKTISLSI